MKTLYPAFAVLLACTASVGAYAAPAGTVLFAQSGTAILDASGGSRPAHRGDLLQPGESIVTSANGISQVTLPDGSLIGVRPGSELKFELPTDTSVQGRPVVSLVQGAMRVIGSELMDANRLSAINLRSGNSLLQMRSADLETAVVPNGASEAVSKGAGEGSYTRLLTGTASVGTGQSVTALAPRQVSYVAPTALLPVTLTTIPSTLFTSSLPTLAIYAAPDLSASKTPSATVAPIVVSTLNPALSNSTPAKPLVVSTPLSIPLNIAVAAVPVAPALATFAPPLIATPLPAMTVTTVATVYIPPAAIYIPPSTAAVTSSTLTKTLSTTTLTCKLVLCR